MEVVIEDITPVTSIDIIGTVPEGVNSKLHVDTPKGSSLLIVPTLLTNAYATSLEAGSYPARLFVGGKKATFVLTESVDLTDLINQML